MYISIERNIYSQLSTYREIYFFCVVLSKKSIVEIMRNMFYNCYCNFIILFIYYILFCYYNISVIAKYFSFFLFRQKESPIIFKKIHNLHKKIN